MPVQRGEPAQPVAATPRLMPEPLFSSTVRNTSIETLLFGRGKHAADSASGMWGDDVPWLMGLIVPPFQRDLEWDEERMARFVESAWLGLHLGNFVFNDLSNNSSEGGRGWRDDKGRDRMPVAHRWLIDGQQRLTALDRYVSDAFPVFGHFWSELGQREQVRFGRIPFASNSLSTTSEHDLRIVYDRLNFGGVAHRPDQRALPEGEAGFESTPRGLRR